MAVSDPLELGRCELQAHAIQVRRLAGEMDQTSSRTEQRVQALLDSWAGLGAVAFGDLFADWRRAAQTCHDSLMAVASRLERSGQACADPDHAANPHRVPRPGGG